MPVPRLETELAATWLLRSALIVYYLALLGGVLLDTKDAEAVLSEAPNEGRFPLVGVGNCVLIALLFGLLCWVDSYKQFAIALAAYWIANMASWKYFVAFLEPAMKRATDVYQLDEEYLLVERVRQMQTFFTSSWHWWRFGLGAVGIAANKPARLL
jgi:hypothetical protein